MFVAVIDDDTSVLKLVASMLRQAGCRTCLFSDPSSALTAIPPQVDLILSDINMHGIDGFAVAERVAAQFGTFPPKTLLMSGNDQQDLLAVTRPSKVIGVLAKPFGFAYLSRVIQFISQTRCLCPGMKAPLCPHAAPRLQCPRAADDPMSPCETRQYSACPHYNTVCGRALWFWIAHRGTEDQLRASGPLLKIDVH